MKFREFSKIVFIGTYQDDKIYSGPTLYVRKIIDSYSFSDASFYFYNSSATIIEKLFQKQSLNMSKDHYQIGIIRLFFELFRTKPAIIHLLDFQRIFIFVGFIKNFINCKFLYTIHGSVVEEDRLKQELPYFYQIKNKMAEKIIFKNASVLISFNEDLAQRCKEQSKSKAIIKRIPAGIDDMYFLSRRKFIQLNQRLHIVCIGGFTTREQSCIELLGKLEKAADLIFVTLVGFANDCIQNAPKFIDISAINKLEQSEWCNLLNNADIFLNTYPNETYSIATLEAMASECVVISLDHLKISELITDGENGYRYKISYPEYVIEIIETLGRNSPLRYSIGHEARKSVNTLRWGNCVEVHQAIYLDILREIG